MRSGESARLVGTTSEGRPSESGVVGPRDQAGKVKVLLAAGARPNFVKVAPLMRALRRCPLFETRLVHTGQHDDPMLSSVFFEELEIPHPDARLEISAATHAEQTAEIMRRFEPVLLAHQPQIVVVVGDVNSTLACALVAAKWRLDHPFWTRDGLRSRPLLVHVEAGLRSFDVEMPEEVNRRLTDALSDVLFVSEPAGLVNLENEGVAAQRIVLVGNVMIDSLVAARGRPRPGVVGGDAERGFAAPYGVVTLHRPANVDDPATLATLLRTLDGLTPELPLVFPVHPRTRSRLQALSTPLEGPRWRIVPPLGYRDFVRLLAGARVVLTDSGGVQEETTFLGVPCLTLRERTERPSTVEQGTNQLVGTSADRIEAGFRRALSGEIRGRVPPLWDGRTAERIVGHLAAVMETEVRTT
jgi:UDP-N-acetylglucosamine 2-epimerase (non-hydrolysing)